jgi:hypothetical protein
VNYEPREDLCAPACALGKKLKSTNIHIFEGSISEKIMEKNFMAL